MRKQNRKGGRRRYSPTRTRLPRLYALLTCNTNKGYWMRKIPHPLEKSTVTPRRRGCTEKTVRLWKVLCNRCERQDPHHYPRGVPTTTAATAGNTISSIPEHTTFEPNDLIAVAGTTTSSMQKIHNVSNHATSSYTTSQGQPWSFTRTQHSRPTTCTDGTYHTPFDRFSIKKKKKSPQGTERRCRKWLCANPLPYEAERWHFPPDQFQSLIAPQPKIVLTPKTAVLKHLVEGMP